MTRRWRSACAVLIVALAGPGALFGQDASASSSDPFDVEAFDQTVKQGQAQDKAAALDMQFGGNLAMNASATTTADFDWFAAAASVSGKAFLKVTVPDYGFAYLAYNYAKNIAQGTGGTPPAALTTTPSGLFDVSFDLAEFYLAFDIARKVFVRVGNQLLAWGPSNIWTPVDFVNLEKANPLAPFDLRVGKPGVRVTAPIGPSNLIVFMDLADTVTGTSSPFGVNNLLDTANLAGRWDVVLAGFELGLSAYVGGSIQNQYGFDFSGRLLGFDVYGELGMAFAYDTYDFAWASSLGFQRTFGELSYWSAAAEFFANSGGTDDPSTYPARVLAGEFTPFYLGQYYAYAALTRTHLGRDGISATLAGFANLSDLSFLARLSTTVSVPRLVPFTFALSWYGGGAGKEFTYFTGDNALTASLSVKYEF